MTTKAPEKKKLKRPAGSKPAPDATAPPTPAPFAPAGASPPSPKNPRFGRNLVIQGAFIMIAAVAVFFFVAAAKNDQMRNACSATCALKPTYAGRNRTAPDFTLVDLDGKAHTLSQYRGKTVVLNFWASWCAPCMQEMPGLARLALALEGRKDIVLLTISTDEDVEQMKQKMITQFVLDEELQRKLPKGRIPFPVLLDPELAVVQKLYGTTQYPETWIVDGEGYIRSRFDGPREWDGATARQTIEVVDEGPGCLVDYGFDPALKKPPETPRPFGRYAALCELE